MAENKYKVELDLPGKEIKTNDVSSKFINPKRAGLIPRSVRIEIAEKGQLPDAPSKKLVEACVLLADISGFTALGEKLTTEHGDAKGAEEFASQISAAISALVNVTHRYEGECVKIAGDCLICTFSAIPSDPEDEGEAKAFERAKESRADDCSFSSHYVLQYESMRLKNYFTCATLCECVTVVSL